MAFSPLMNDIMVVVNEKLLSAKEAEPKESKQMMLSMYNWFVGKGEWKLETKNLDDILNEIAENLGQTLECLNCATLGIKCACNRKSKSEKVQKRKRISSKAKSSDSPKIKQKPIIRKRKKVTITMSDLESSGDDFRP